MKNTLIALVIFLSQTTAQAMNLHKGSMCMSALMHVRTTMQAKAAQTAKESFREFRQLVIKQPLHGASLKEISTNSTDASESKIKAIAQRIEGIEQQEGKFTQEENDPSKVTILAAEYVGEDVNQFLEQLYQNNRLLYESIQNENLIKTGGTLVSPKISSNAVCVFNTGILAGCLQGLLTYPVLEVVNHYLGASIANVLGDTYLVLLVGEILTNASGKLINSLREEMKLNRSDRFFETASNILSSDNQTAEWSFLSINFDVYKELADIFLNPSTNISDLENNARSATARSSFGLLYKLCEQSSLLILKESGETQIQTNLMVDMLLQKVKNADGEMVPKLTLMVRISDKPKVEVKAREESKEGLRDLVPVRENADSRR